MRNWGRTHCRMPASRLTGTGANTPRRHMTRTCARSFAPGRAIFSVSAGGFTFQASNTPEKVDASASPDSEAATAKHWPTGRHVWTRWRKLPSNRIVRCMSCIMVVFSIQKLPPASASPTPERGGWGWWPMSKWPLVSHVGSAVAIRSFRQRIAVASKACPRTRTSPAVCIHAALGWTKLRADRRAVRTWEGPCPWHHRNGSRTSSWLPHSLCFWRKT